MCVMLWRPSRSLTCCSASLPPLASIVSIKLLEMEEARQQSLSAGRNGEDARYRLLDSRDAVLRGMETDGFEVFPIVHYCFCHRRRGDCSEDGVWVDFAQ
jgi:hypothetical protein